jgi:hypothetical protein
MRNLATIGRASLVLAVALLLATTLVNVADAKRNKTSTPVSQRVQNQKDQCTAEGGDFSSTKTPFGTTITNCEGGNDGDWSCVNSQTSTNCHPNLTTTPQDPDNRPTDGNYGDFTGDGNPGTARVGVNPGKAHRGGGKGRAHHKR